MRRVGWGRAWDSQQQQLPVPSLPENRCSWAWSGGAHRPPLGWSQRGPCRRALPDPPCACPGPHRTRPPACHSSIYSSHPFTHPPQTAPGDFHLSHSHPPLSESFVPYWLLLLGLCKAVPVQPTPQEAKQVAWPPALCSLSHFIGFCWCSSATWPCVAPPWKSTSKGASM